MSRTGQTCLHLAAEAARDSDSVAILRSVLKHSTNINAKDQVGDQTPLYLAVENADEGFTAGIEMLIRRGANLHDRVRITILGFEQSIVSELSPLNLFFEIFRPIKLSGTAKVCQRHVSVRY